jgi:hypothetical protein
MMISIIFLILNIFFAVLLFYLCIAFLTGAPYVPSNKNASESMICLATIKKGKKIVDLGSGDGNLLFRSARLGASVTGYEINPFLVILTLLRTLFSPYKKQVSIYWRDMWKANISDADVVFVYLLPWKMKKLEEKLFTEMKKGSLVVSNSFIFPDKKPETSDTKNHIYTFRIRK